MLENAKQQLLDAVGSFNDVDFARTPSFFFFSYLSEEMVSLGLDEWIEPVLASIKIDLGALGLEGEPHKEWLASMAKHYANLINKMIMAFLIFGEDVVRGQISGLSLSLK